MEAPTPLTLGFLQFMETAPDAMVCVNQAGHIVLVNAQAENLFGHERLELLGKPVEMLIPERVRGMHVGHRDSYIADAHVRSMGLGLKLSARRKDGSEFPVEISLSPITTPDGAITAASIRDITARQRSESKFRGLLEAAPDAMDIVDSGGSITLVNAQTERMFGHTRDALVGRKIETLIPQRFHPKHVGHRYGFFHDPKVRGLLEASRFQAGKLKLHIDTFDVAKIVQETVESFQPDAAEKKIEIILAGDPDFQITADRGRLLQILYNVLGNALKFSPEGTRVTLGTTKAKGTVHFVIKDEGLGMTADQMTRLFTPFTRLHEGAAPGAGLGLCISQGYAAAHGGLITCHSDGPGKGCTFTVALPQRPPAQQEALP